MHEVLVNRLGGLSLPRKSVVRLTDRPTRPWMFTVDIHVKQQINNNSFKGSNCKVMDTALLGKLFCKWTDLVYF